MMSALEVLLLAFFLIFIVSIYEGMRKAGVPEG